VGAVRAEREQSADGTGGPAEDDRPAVGRPGRVSSRLRRIRVTTAQQSSKAGAVPVHDPQGRAIGAGRPTAEDEPVVIRPPTRSRAVGCDPTNLMEVAAVAVHDHERAALEAALRVVEALALECDARPGSRPDRVEVDLGAPVTFVNCVRASLASRR
jgi:hypothetical protein